MTNDLLKRLQQTEVSIMEDVHNYCSKNDIQYSLFYGTAIGAVRHSGFIPWDDDIDIAMTRENYIKFCNCWNDSPMCGYFLQNIESDPFAGINHAKVRKNGTVLLSEGEVKENGHHGIWIDIFILDKVPNDNRIEKTIKLNAYKRFAFTRADALSTLETGKSKIIKQILDLIPRKIRVKGLNKAENKIQSYNNLTQNYCWMSLSCPDELKYRFPKALVENYELIDFEDKKFYVFKDVRIALEMVYGDYMQLPPKEQQKCKHNPVMVEL